jgi:hypothetical protein
LGCISDCRMYDDQSSQLIQSRSRDSAFKVVDVNGRLRRMDSSGAGSADGRMSRSSRWSSRMEKRRDETTPVSVPVLQLYLRTQETMLCKTRQMDKQEGSSHDRHVIIRSRDDSGTECEERWLRAWWCTGGPRALKGAGGALVFLDGPCGPVVQKLKERDAE